MAANSLWSRLSKVPQFLIGTAFGSLQRGEAGPRFGAHRSGAHSPGRARPETKGTGTDQTTPADRPHPVPSGPLACARAAISRGLGVRVPGAPRRVEAATEEDEDVGVIPAARGQWRYARPDALVASWTTLPLSFLPQGCDHHLSLPARALADSPGRLGQQRDGDGRSLLQTVASADMCAPYADGDAHCC